MQLRGAGDRNNPRLLGQQPGERNLGRCCLFLFCDAAEQINQGLVRLERFRSETREGAAEVGAIEGRFLVHLPREKTLAQRAVRHEADSEFLQGRYHFLLRGSRPQRVFALERSDRLDLVRATDRLHSRFGKAEALDLTLLNHLPYSSGHVLDRHVQINPVLIEEVDFLDLESLERALDGLLDVLGPAIQSRRALHPAGIEVTAHVEPEFGGDHHLLAERSERFTHKLFVQERTVDLRGVEKCDAAFQDRKSTRLNSSHLVISYAVFCLKKKKKKLTKREQSAHSQSL